MKNTIDIIYRKIADLKPYANALRIHDRAQRQKARKLLERFGQVVPIIIDPESLIVDGHLIVEELKALGYDEVATVTVRNRDPAEIRALRLALNRLPQDAKWDDVRLKFDFSELLDIGFDLSFTGFDTVDIDMVLSIEDPASGVVEDAPPEVDPNAAAVSHSGDIWVLGDHRVTCGDARDPKVIAKLANGEMAQMVFCDPPYNVRIDGNVSGLGKQRHREFAMASGEMSSAQFTAFLVDYHTAFKPFLQDGAIVYDCMDWRHLMDLMVAVDKVGLTPMNLCVWAKTNAGMGTFYRSQHELVYISKKGTAPHINNFELGKKGRSRSNLWTYRGMNVVGQKRDELLRLHPTVKPVALVADAIKDVSHRSGIILDPFLGSGTTLIAAEITGRRCYGVEYDPLYCDLIVRRWMDQTGGTAFLEATGESFVSLEEMYSTERPATTLPAASNDKEA